MRSAVLLVLFFTLSDGSNNVSFSNNEPEVFSDLYSNRVQPCERSRDNNGYNRFRRRHVLSSSFNTRRARDWEEYLTRNHLCGRQLVQSFLRKSDNDSVVRICNGRGNRVTLNQCISTREFRVYVVHSAVRNGRCVVRAVGSVDRYVIVSCEVLENRCLPVHYVTQTSSRPSALGPPCTP